VNEWIVRVLPLPLRAPVLQDGPNTDLARFRIRIVAPADRPAGVIHRDRQAAMDIGPVRILALDTVNPHGGVGGSLDSDQCAWLVRELDRARDRYVVLATHHGPRTLTSDARPPSAAPRVLGREILSILTVHDSVVAWICGTTHERSGVRHGAAPHGFWELPGSATGTGAPLAGGLALSAHREPHGRRIVMSGALAGESGPRWSLRDPLFTNRSSDGSPAFTSSALVGHPDR
jgi:hypothetical protein